MTSSPISASNPERTPMLRVTILGALRVHDQRGLVPIPRAAHHLIAVLAAAGQTGISRDELAHELWGSNLPGSWMSALRNRTTAARKALGSSSLLSSNGRYCFGPHVRVDSWDLIEHALDATVPGHEFDFLDGVPLVDVPASKLTTAHAVRVREARIALIDQELTSGNRLSTRALQALRIYQREKQLDPAIAVATVRAHMLANERKHAVSVLAGVKEAANQLTETPTWVSHLEQSLVSTPPAETKHGVADMRARLFDEAAHNKNWSLALEVAMEGGPEAERSDGDPDRLALFEQIPPEELETPLQFELALAMFRQLTYVGRQDEARAWSDQLRELATTPNEILLSSIARFVVGDVEDERAPISLPDAFDDMPPASVNMRSLQVVVMSHHKCGSFEDAQAVQKRFTELVELRGEPYRRWHLLLLQSMNMFVDGRLKDARGASEAAFSFASLFGIFDAEKVHIGQLSNARLIDPNMKETHDFENEYQASASSSLSRALQAISRAQRTGDDAVDQFLRTYDYRRLFAFAMVNLLAPHIRDPVVRADVATQLRRRTGTSAIWGTGVLHLGPVDRNLARVVLDRSEIPDLLEGAIAVADRQRARLWQVVCRLDLAAATDAEGARQQAEELAITPDLQDLLTTYEPWPSAVPG